MSSKAHLLLDSIAAVFEQQQAAWAPGPILGRRYVLPEFKSLFDDDLSINDLAQIIVTDEISDPTGHGQVLPVDWAKGLVLPGQPVEWAGIDHRGSTFP